MDWLASLKIEWVLFIAFTLVFVRVGLLLARHSVGPKREEAIGETIESLLFAWVVVFMAIRPFAYEPFRIPSPSMRETLIEGDRIVVSKYDYRFRSPARGDVVVFRAPKEADPNEVDFVKRLIGLPGDEITVDGGQVAINGVPLEEPYAQGVTEDQSFRGGLEPPYRVPDGCYFMMGDNREHSMDSRSWGFLARNRIKGRAVAIFWPPSRIKKLPDYRSVFPEQAERHPKRMPSPAGKAG